MFEIDDEEKQQHTKKPLRIEINLSLQEIKDFSLPQKFKKCSEPHTCKMM